MANKEVGILEAPKMSIYNASLDNPPHLQRDLREFVDTVRAHMGRVLILSAVDVDAVCACKILTWWLDTEGLMYVVTPVITEADIADAFEKHATEEVLDVIMLNCGGMQSVAKDERWRDALIQRRLQLHIFDSHRPFHLDNVYTDNLIIYIREDEKLDDLPSFKALFQPPLGATPANDELVSAQSLVDHDDDDDGYDVEVGDSDSNDGVQNTRRKKHAKRSLDADENLNASADDSNDVFGLANRESHGDHDVSNGSSILNGNYADKVKKRCNRRIGSNGHENSVQSADDEDARGGPAAADSDDENANDDDDDAESVVSEIGHRNNNRRGGAGKRNKVIDEEVDYETWKQRREIITDQYYGNENYYFGCTALLMFEMCHQVNCDSVELLWYAVLALTDMLLHNKLTSMTYGMFCRETVEHLSRLQAAVVVLDRADNSSSSGLRNYIRVTLERDLHLLFYRHWNMYDALNNTQGVYSRLKLWLQTGRNDLHHYLAKCGIPLRECKQNYRCMAIDLQENIKQYLEKESAAMCEGGLFTECFVMVKGKYEFSAFDWARALFTVINVSNADATKKDRFNDAFALLTTNYLDNVARAVELGMRMAVAHREQIDMFMASRQTFAPFGRVVFVIHEVTSEEDARFFCEPESLSALAAFAQDAYEASNFNRKRYFPFVLGLHIRSHDDVLVVGLPPKYMDAVVQQAVDPDAEKADKSAAGQQQPARRIRIDQTRNLMGTAFESAIELHEEQTHERIHYRRDLSLSYAIWLPHHHWTVFKELIVNVLADV